VKTRMITWLRSSTFFSQFQGWSLISIKLSHFGMGFLTSNLIGSWNISKSGLLKDKWQNYWVWPSSLTWKCRT
jgi:hypothetical protein